MRSSQPVSTSARHHRLPILYRNSRRRAGKDDAVQFRWLSVGLSILILILCLGGLLSLHFHPLPRGGDFHVDDAQDAATSRKGLRDGTDVESPRLYTLLESLFDIDGQQLRRRDVENRVLLIANVASQCGYTASNYEAFRDLLRKHYAAGLRVVALPCGQFGDQEYDSENDIRRFVRDSYDLPSTPITLMKKIEDDINDSNELFAFLRSQLSAADGGKVTWNFNKWLVDRQGNVRQRFDSNSHFGDLDREISRLLSDV